MRKYPPQRVIAVDVDGTLIINGIVNEKLVNLCKKKKKEGFTMILWSAGGQNHAIKAAKLSGLNDVFDHIISKPGYIIDDMGWNLVKYTEIIY